MVMLEDKNSQEELRSRIEAFKLMAVLFILFLFATLSSKIFECRSGNRCAGAYSQIFDSWRHDGDFFRANRDDRRQPNYWCLPALC